MHKSALIIDHNDSFVWNIKSWLEPEFKITMMNYSEIASSSLFLESFDLIILSPGPKSPQDYPHSLNLLESHQAQPILGICLGFQMMVLSAGGQVEKYSPPRHGKKSWLQTENNLFRNRQVGRYHSLKCLPSSDFKILAYSEDDQCVMWAEHQTRKQIGFQFHPESFLTESPELYKKYLLDWIS